MKRGILCSVVFLVLLSSFSLGATPFNPALGSHPLQQVTTDQTGATSVDANSDGIVDQANTALSIGDQTAIGDGTGNAILSIKGATTLWSAIDFYSGNTAYWGVGRSKVFGDYRDNDFYIDRTGVRRALTIDQSTLNVGIDTDKPQNKLDVRGAIGLSLSDTQTVAKLYQSANDGNLELFTGEATPVSRIRLNSYGNSYIAPASGKVGIGTASPSVKLHVYDPSSTTESLIESDSGNAALSIDSSSTSNFAYVLFKHAGTQYWETGSDSANNQNFFIYSFQKSGGGDRVFSITKDGSVGIGTASPPYQFQVENAGTATLSLSSGVGGANRMWWLSAYKLAGADA